MNSLLGMELPTPVTVIIAFVVVLVLIGAATWLVRRFGAARFEATLRGRQPRLAVIDSANVDGRRKLVIIRRDNVEHLLMIGGPTDVVVETNIVRAAAAREPAMARNGAEAGPRAAMPLPEAAPWPVQPEPMPMPPPAPAPAPAVAARPDRGPRVVVSDAQWQTPMEPAAAAPPLRAVRPADTLAGLAEELARPAAEPAAPRPAQAEPAHGAPPQAAAAAPNGPQAVAPPDHSLAEMAQRLEAALRRPAAQKPAPESPRAAVAAEPRPAARPEPRVAAAGGRGDGPPNAPSGNLEQEMASLLHRPGKT